MTNHRFSLTGWTTPLALARALLACGSADDAACPADTACKGTAQSPAVGAKADIEAWFASGAYLKWKCEAPGVGAGRDDAHGPNRVCSNDLLSASSSGDFPVGAANVKELRESNGAIKGYAFMLKVKPGGGSGNWYWYEKTGSRTVANAVADSSCTSCHDRAPRDGVRIRVQ
jgi:hypothetical protein